MKEKHIKHYKILVFTFFFLILPLFSYTIQISGKQNSQIIGSKDFDEKRDVLPKASYWDDYVDDHVSGGVGSTMNFERMTQNNELYATLEEEYISGIALWLLSQTYRFNDINYFHEVEYLCIDVGSLAFNAPLDVYGGISTSSMHYMGQISIAGETDLLISNWLTGTPFYVKLLSTTEEDKGPYYIKRMHIVYDGAITPPGTPVLNQPTTPDYDGDIDLSWSRAGDEAGYRIYRNTIYISEVGAGVTSWTDTNLDAGTYTYYIQAYNDGGTSNSDGETVIVSAPGNPTLEQPISPDIDGNIELSWSNVVGENGYRIYRNTTNVHEVGADITSWTDIGVPEGNYEYRIKAFNTIGTTDSNIVSVEVLLPQLCWLTPVSGNIEFDPEPGPNTARFNFTFHSKDLDSVELWLNGVNYSDVTVHPEFVDLPYSEEINGSVTAILKGYVGASCIIEDSRLFNFTKFTRDEIIVLNQSVEVVGEKLYLILYDPNGDNSWSGWTEESSFSIGVGGTVTNAIGLGLSVSAEFSLFGVIPGEISVGMEYKETNEEGFDFRYEVSECSSLKSNNLEDTDADYIGPGYGDAYWGEAWLLPWKLEAREKEYWGGTIEYLEPTFKYGINRSSMVLLSEYDAPDDWTSQNLVHMGYPEEDIEWLVTLGVSGGHPFERTHTEMNTSINSNSFTIDLGVDASLKLGWVETTIEFDLSTKCYDDVEQTEISEIQFCIHDNDPDDYITNEYGIDKRFGTYVFKTISELCFTSNPLEHNTQDYIHPEIEFPEITLDTSGDGRGPCIDDEPLIVVNIEDESGIQEAFIRYSINDGLNWANIELTEQTANPDFWEGLIPAQPHETNVQWYIYAKDNFNLVNERKDQWGEPWKFTILNREPTVTIIGPNGAEEFNESVQIEWISFDADNDNLTFTLSYKIGSSGWHIIDRNITGNTYTWNVNDAFNYKSDSILIKVVVNDGYGGETEDESDYCFTVNANSSFNIPGIPGYPLIILLSIMTIAITAVVVIIQRKKYKF